MPFKILYASMQAAQTPASKLRLVTPDKESSVNTFWQEGDFEQICSRESLTEKAVEFGKTISEKEHERERYKCQVCHSPFDEGKMLLCDICNAGWHMDCLLHTLTTIPAGIWKCPFCTPAAPSSQGPLRHLRFPSPILDPDSD